MRRSSRPLPFCEPARLALFFAGHMLGYASVRVRGGDEHAAIERRVGVCFNTTPYYYFNEQKKTVGYGRLRHIDCLHSE